jgi:hypothetical protein
MPPSARMPDVSIGIEVFWFGEWAKAEAPRRISAPQSS